MNLRKLTVLPVCIFASVCACGAGLRYGWGSLERLEKEARKGKAPAQADLGRYYLLAGEYMQALPWLRKAAGRGDAEGLYGLGFCYETGYCGVEKNLGKAAKYYKKSARKNSPGGLYQTALFLYGGVVGRANPEKALEYMRRAADEGSMDARRFLAVSYAEGETAGVKRNCREAAKYWAMLAAAGDAQACYRLGNSYDYGYGVPQDCRRAFEWYLRAARLGLAEGQYRTGAAYLHGRGVEVNRKRGIRWLEKAAAQGNIEAQEELKTQQRDNILIKNPL